MDNTPSLPAWTMYIKLVSLPMHAFLLYLVWTSNIGICLQVILTPVAIAAVNTVYNIFIATPMIAYFTHQIETRLSIQAGSQEQSPYKGSLSPNELVEIWIEAFVQEMDRLKSGSHRVNSIWRTDPNYDRQVVVREFLVLQLFLRTVVFAGHGNNKGTIKDLLHSYSSQAFACMVEAGLVSHNITMGSFYEGRVGVYSKSLREDTGLAVMRLSMDFMGFCRLTDQDAALRNMTMIGDYLVLEKQVLAIAEQTTNLN